MAAAAAAAEQLTRRSKECPSADPMLPLGSDQHASGNCKPCAFVRKQRGCDKGASCSFCHLCTEDEYKAKVGKRKGEANDRIRKKFKSMDDHIDKPGHVTATRSSERSSIRVCCEDCCSASGPARMGPLRTCDAGTFKCNGCWDSEDEAVRAEKARVSIRVRPPFDYRLVGIGKSPQRCRLRMRNANDTWQIQFKDKTYADGIPGDKLELDTKDRVESLQKFKTILDIIFEDLKLKSPGSLRRVFMPDLPDIFWEVHDRWLDPRALGHPQLSRVMTDAEVAEKFRLEGLYIYKTLPTCNETLE